MTKHSTHSHKDHKDKHKAPKPSSELLSELPLEDKLWMLWERYSRYAILVVALIIFAFLGIKGVSWYKSWQVEKLQNEFRDAHAEGREVALAEKNIKEPLAGAVFTNLADRSSDEGQLDEALINYKKALKSLQGTPVGDRIEFGIAMVTYSQGDKDKGKDLLKKLVNNEGYMDAIRGEAAYQLIFINLQEKDYASAKDYLTVLSRIPNAGIWAQKASVLQETTPELKPN